jgi:hypothetical protein
MSFNLSFRRDSLQRLMAQICFATSALVRSLRRAWDTYFVTTTNSKSGAVHRGSREHDTATFWTEEAADLDMHAAAKLA